MIQLDYVEVHIIYSLCCSVLSYTLCLPILTGMYVTLTSMVGIVVKQEFVLSIYPYASHLE